MSARSARGGKKPSNHKADRRNVNDALRFLTGCVNTGNPPAVNARKGAAVSARAFVDDDVGSQ